MLECLEGRTLLDVREGCVRITRRSDGSSAEVTSGFRLAASPGLPFRSERTPGTPRLASLDRNAPIRKGDGSWRIDRQEIRQSRISRRTDDDARSTLLFRTHTEENFCLEATEVLEEPPPDLPGPWG